MKTKVEPIISRGFLRWMILIFLVCLAIEIIGTVIGVLGFVGVWTSSSVINAIWIVINILITLFVLMQIGFYAVNAYDSGVAGLVGLAFFIVAISSIVCVSQYWLGAYSIVLLCTLVVLLLINLYVAVLINNIENATEEKIVPEVISEDEALCSICKEASLYTVCMKCERKYQREIQRVRSQNWRAKKAGEPSTLTIAEWLHTLEAFHHHCAYCQTGPYELMEHYIPIGQGKKDGGTTALNCVPSCFKCNTQKKNKHPEK